MQNQIQISPREGLAPSAGTGAPALEGQGEVAARAAAEAAAAGLAQAKDFHPTHASLKSVTNLPECLLKKIRDIYLTIADYYNWASTAKFGRHASISKQLKNVHPSFKNKHLATNYSILTLDIQPYMFNSLHTLNGHTDYVVSVTQLQDGRIVSGSHDGTLKVWDLTRPAGEECIHTLGGHNGAIYNVIQLKDGRIVSGSEDGALKVWDLTRPAGKECIATLKDTDNPVLKDPDKPVLTVIQLKDARIIAGYCDKTLKVWGKEEVSKEEVSNKIKKLQNRSLTPEELKEKKAANQVLPSETQSKKLNKKLKNRSLNTKKLEA